jgi:hypothetical protein
MLPALSRDVVHRVGLARSSLQPAWMLDPGADEVYRMGLEAS